VPLTKQIRRRVERAVRYLKAGRIDLQLWITGKTNPHAPPMRLQVTGVGDFDKIGDEFLRLLIGIGGLRPTDRVLDIGSGIGRIALPLTGYVRTPATYDGFDVMKGAVRWCKTNISNRHPNFRFQHVDVSNSEYNPRGMPASRFRFPFDDAAFDFAFAVSVFTHLMPDETRQYLRESSRVLIADGRLFVTFFLLNETSIAALPKHGTFSFPVVQGPIRLQDADHPAIGVAYNQDFVEELMRDSSLVIERIEYGQWTGRRAAPTFQDVVLCRRVGSAAPA